MVSRRLERKACCLHVGESNQLLLLGRRSLILFFNCFDFCFLPREERKKKTPLWNIRQGKSNFAKKEGLGNRFLELKGAIG